MIWCFMKMKLVSGWVKVSQRSGHRRSLTTVIRTYISGQRKKEKEREKDLTRSRLIDSQMSE